MGVGSHGDHRDLIFWFGRLYSAGFRRTTEPRAALGTTKGALGADGNERAGQDDSAEARQGTGADGIKRDQNILRQGYMNWVLGVLGVLGVGCWGAGCWG